MHDLGSYLESVSTFYQGEEEKYKIMDGPLEAKLEQGEQRQVSACPAKLQDESNSMGLERPNERERRLKFEPRARACTADRQNCRIRCKGAAILQAQALIINALTPVPNCISETPRVPTRSEIRGHRVPRAPDQTISVGCTVRAC